MKIVLADQLLDFEEIEISVACFEPEQDGMIWQGVDSWIPEWEGSAL